MKELQVKRLSRTKQYVGGAGRRGVWKQKAGAANKACADCHGPAEESMKGVSARYPAFNASASKPIDVQGQVNQCRSERQQAAPFRFESRELLALTT